MQFCKTKERQGRSFFTLWILIFFTTSLQAYDPELDWQTIKTPHFKIHFAKENQFIAERLAPLAESLHQTMSVKYQWTPLEPTHIVITDHTDIANGYATIFPINRAVLFVHPPAAGALDLDDWLAQVFEHEYTHVLHLDKSNDTPQQLRHIFGRFNLLFPNAYQPSWIIEGLATHQETVFQKAIGRGQSSLFQMMMREELRSGFKGIAEVNIAAPSWPLNARYLYGVYFFQFLQDRYGEQAIQSIIEAYSDNWIPFFINDAVHQVTGKNYHQLWQEFEVYLRARPELTIEQSKLDFITDNGFWKSDIQVDGQQLYWIESDGVYRPRLRVRDIQQEDSTKTLAVLNGVGFFDLHEQAGIVIAQPEVCNEFYTFYDLYHLEPTTEKLTRLTECSRYQEVVWEPNGHSMLAIKADAGIFYLDRLTAEGSFIERLWQWQENEIVSYIDLSDDGKSLVASVQRTGKPRANIERFDLSSKQWKPLLSFNAHQWYPKFEQQDQAVTFSSDLTGTFQIYRFWLNENRLERLTNDGRGIFLSEPKSSTTRLALAYRASGYDLARLKDRSYTIANAELAPTEVTSAPNHRELVQADRLGSLEKSQQTDSSETQPPDKPSLSLELEPYQPWDSLSPKFWFPFAVGNEDSVDFGFQFEGSDAVEIHSYQLRASLDIERNLANAFFTYRYANRWDLRLENFNNVVANFRNTGIDEIEVNRLAEIHYRIPKTRFLSTWEVSLSVSSDFRELGLFRDGVRQASGDFIDTLVGFSVSNITSTQLTRSISESDGHNFRFTAATSNWLNSDFSGRSAVFDWREFIQVADEQVLALRAVIASGEQGSQRFELGGTFTDQFFLRRPTLIQRDYSLRGYPENLSALSGRQLRLLSAEYRFPFTHLERTAMAPPIGIDRVSGRIFAERGAAWDNQRGRIYGSSGAEILAMLRIGYVLNLDLRIGYANGHDPQFGDDQVYFRIGTSF